MFLFPYFCFLFLCLCRDDVLIDNPNCPCTIGQIAEAFRPTGFLCSFTVSVGTFLLGRKFKGSTKLVAPYVVSVCTFHPFVTCLCELLTFSCMNCLFILIWTSFFYTVIVFPEAHFRRESELQACEEFLSSRIWRARRPERNCKPFLTHISPCGLFCF